jgi:hypothetical protein
MRAMNGAPADDENGADIDRQKVTLYLGNRGTRGQRPGGKEPPGRHVN